MFYIAIVNDFILLFRLVPAVMSCKSTGWLKFYYNYRMVTFWILIGLWVAGFIYSFLLVIYTDDYAYIPMIESIGGVAILLMDYKFCSVVRKQLKKAIEKDREKQRKIKGRMLSQKAHKGSVRIDTPPPFDIKSIGSRYGSRGPRQKIHPSSVS